MLGVGYIGYIKTWLPNGESKQLFQLKRNVSRATLSSIIFSHVHVFFYSQLDFQSEPGSCLAIFEIDIETELMYLTCKNMFKRLPWIRAFICTSNHM